MWRSSPVQRLVVSIIVPLVKIIIFSVKHTVHGTSFILLGGYVGIPLRVLLLNICFITLYYG